MGSLFSAVLSLGLFRVVLLHFFLFSLSPCRSEPHGRLTGWVCSDAGRGWCRQREKNDLLEELLLLPENAVVRRINELVKRARSVKVHAYIIHYLRKQMPYMMGKQEKQVRRWS